MPKEKARWSQRDRSSYEYMYNKQNRFACLGVACLSLIASRSQNSLSLHDLVV